MGSRDEKFRFRINCSSIILSFLCFWPLSVWGGGSVDTEFFEKYNLSPREKCEVYFSWNQTNELKTVNCDQIQTFQAIKTISLATQSKTPEIFLSSQDDDWPLTNMHIKTKLEGGELSIASLLVNGADFNISEYLFANQKSFTSVEVGFIGEVIMIQLRNSSMTQLSIIPKYCRDKDTNWVEYYINQSFSWYPPFQEDSYIKTFFKTPSCT